MFVFQIIKAQSITRAGCELTAAILARTTPVRIEFVAGIYNHG
jgi:hypothetical protein